MEKSDRSSKRRFFQFSLRSLFALMLLAALLCGTVGVRMVYVGDQRAVARRLSGVAARSIGPTGANVAESSITWEEMPSYLGVRPLDWVRDLLGDDFYSNVVAISLPYNRQLTDDDLAQLNRLDDLRRLKLNLTPISDAGLQHLGELPRLESLDVGSTDVGDTGLAYLDGAPELVAVGLSFTTVTDKGVTHLAATHPQLRRLDLSSTAATDVALASLAGCKELERLILCDTDVTSAGITALGALPQLRVLALNNTAVDDDAMGALARLPNLEELYLRYVAVSDTGIKKLADAPKLRVLQICGTEVTDAGIANLAHIGTLKALDLRGVDLTDAGIAPLVDLDLDLLLVQNTGVTPDGLARLADLPEDLETAFANELSRTAGPAARTPIMYTVDENGQTIARAVAINCRIGPVMLRGKPIKFARLELVSQAEFEVLRQIPSKSLSPAQRKLLDSTDDARLEGNLSID